MKLKIPKIPKVEMFGIDIVKNFLLFFLFFIIFMILLAFVVSPTIKRFKEIKQNYYAKKIKAQDLQSKLDKLTMQYKDLYKKNRKIILAFKMDFNKDAFKIFSSKYMNITNIQDKNISLYQSQFIKKSYIVTANLKSPINFYKFVDATKNTNNIIQIHFPIVFKAKNGDIKLIYKLESFKEMK